MELEVVGIILLILAGIGVIVFAVWVYFTIYVAFMEIRDGIVGIDNNFEKLVNSTRK